MKITLCGSIAFYDEMLKTKSELEKMLHEVKLPPIEVNGPNNEIIPVKRYYELRKSSKSMEGWIWDVKGGAIKNHFNKIVWSDAILVYNKEKNGVFGYIGGNTLMEMGLAFFFNKLIYLMYSPIPELSYKEEIIGMKPIVINSDLTKIK